MSIKDSTQDSKMPVYADTSPISQASEGVVLPDWTPEEERKAKTKVDLILLPIVIAAFFALQLDRGNISNALTSTLTKDLRITTDQVNTGSQLFNVGILILELPSNMLMQYFGPRNWLSGQIFAWGLTATFQIFMVNYAGFLTSRLFLGLLEAGFVPGALYYVTSWYTKSETSLRIMIFFLGQNFASATANLIASGLLKLTNKSGLAGWQWIFLVEGIFTLFIAIVFLLFLPPAVGNGKPLASLGRWSYFTDRESHIIINRVLLDDPSKSSGKVRIKGKDILNTMANPKIWLHAGVTLVSLAATHGLTIYTPSMIKSFGFSTIRANALSSVWAYGAMVLNFVLAFCADRTGHRGPFVLIAASWSLITYSCMNTLHKITDKWAKYAVVILANISYSSPHVLNIGWVTVHCKTPAERSVSSVMMIMSASLGGIAGGRTFGSDDAPAYRKGLVVNTGIAVVTWTVAAVLGGWYFIDEKRDKAKANSHQMAIEDQVVQDVEKSELALDVSVVANGLLK